jgi:hypothetical protein
MKSGEIAPRLWSAVADDAQLCIVTTHRRRFYALGMWQRYFGPLARVVGIDIDPVCKAHEAPGVFVRTGDQSDERFLASVIEEFGIPDIALDDGSHRMEHMAKSFLFLYPQMPKNGVYVVEDLHAAYWEEYGGGASKPDSFINLAKNFIDRLNADVDRKSESSGPTCG